MFQIAEKYVRFLIRGKLGRSVPVLLDEEMKCCIDLLLQCRKQAKIPSGNPYIFALPGYDKKRFKYIRACELLRTYSVQCGASMPLRLRGTKLRKHIATKCITLNLSDNDITQLANYMGHERAIHMQHYRQSIPQIEIVKMSRLLKIAQGEIDSEEQDYLQINSNENDFTTHETCDIGNDTDGHNTDTSAACDTLRKRKRRSSKNIRIYYALYFCYILIFCKNTYRLSTASPYGSTKRVRWTKEESNVILTAFKKEIIQHRLPSGKQMVELKMKNKCLNRRSVPQIRSWIHNQISKKRKSCNNGE